MKLRAALPYVAVFGIAAFLFQQSGAFVALGREGQLSPAFWPRAVLTLLMVVCAFEVVRVAFFFKPEAPVMGEDDEDAPRFWHLLAGGIAITVLYVPAMEYLGFFLATIAYLAAFMYIGRYRRPVVVAVTSVVGTIAFVFVFMKVVYVSLPLGAGPFRQLSAWVLAALGVH
jgi:putative tricarboxylic transport membrane protein